MKKTFVAALFITAAQLLQAQDKPLPVFTPSYAVKWNPSSLYFGKLSMQGEYNFKKKKSVTLNVGIPMNKTLTATMDGKDRSLNMKSFSLMGGYRMYLGKKTMTGMYFEPFLKYVKNDANAVISADISDQPTDLYTTSKYSAIGLGGQLGVQFMIAKRVTFDFFFLGPEANSAKHSVVMQDLSPGTWDSNDAADAQQEIDDNIGDLPIIGNHLKVNVDADNKKVSSDFKGFLPGVRFGLSVGVHF